MRISIRFDQILFFTTGLLLLIVGMVFEFLLATILPDFLMTALFEQGWLLILICVFFASGAILLRRAILGNWWYGYDYIIFIIAGIIFIASSLMTVFRLQTGHPYLDLAIVNPLLMIFLWIFILPPINPSVTFGFALFFFFLALIFYLPHRWNTITYRNTTIPIDSPPVNRWQILIRITRVNVWLGSLFLIIIAFLILGGSPLSSTPLPLYDIGKWIRLLIALTATALFNSCVFILNQLGDIDTDRHHEMKSQLPLSAGLISQRQGLFLVIVLMVVGILLSLIVGLHYLLLLTLTILFAVIYSLPPIRLKNRPFLDLIIIGLAFGSWAILAAWTVLHFRPELPFLLLIGPGVFYAGTHGIHTASDYPADIEAGLRTTAIFLGPKRAAKFGITLIAIGLLLLYTAVGFHTHIFWYGLLKYKSIFLLIFSGLPVFALLYEYRSWQKSETEQEVGIQRVQIQARWVSYLLFLILLIYLVLYAFIFYPIYYPNYEFPWS
ncbi:MAG: UbiA prenyltransferase family protein [Candidatus Hodarchaeota archaeon]